MGQKLGEKIHVEYNSSESEGVQWRKVLEKCFRGLRAARDVVFSNYSAHTATRGMSLCSYVYYDAYSAIGLSF